jgi:hypothetical protein
MAGDAGPTPERVTASREAASRRCAGGRPVPPSLRGHRSFASDGYLVQCGEKEQASEAAIHGATVQVAEQGLPQVRTDTPPTASWTAPSSSARRVSRWRASFFRLFFIPLPLSVDEARAYTQTRGSRASARRSLWTLWRTTKGRGQLESALRLLGGPRRQRKHAAHKSPVSRDDADAPRRESKTTARTSTPTQGGRSGCARSSLGSLSSGVSMTSLPSLSRRLL